MSRDSRTLNLSYYGSLVARMGDVLFILFLNLWVSSFFHDSEISSNIDDAKRITQMISGIGGVLILVFSFAIGWASDKVSFPLSVTAIYGARAVFSILVYFSDDPHSVMAFCALLFGYVFNGFGNIIVGAFFYKSIKQEFKGIVNGIYLFFGTVGVILISKVGAQLFEGVGIGTPFLLGAAFDISFILLMWIFK